MRSDLHMLSNNNRPSGSFSEGPLQSAFVEPHYCLSYTTTFFTSWPAASLPTNVDVRNFPSADTTDVTVIIVCAPFFMLTRRVFESTRSTETMSPAAIPVAG